MERNPQRQHEIGGFSLVEVVIAMALMMVAVFGVISTFTFAVNFNTGSSLRSQCLAVSQQEIEVMRSAKFTPLVTDQTLTGGTKTPKTVTTADGNKFTVATTVDDDPSTDGIQIDPTRTLKEISVTVTPQNVTATWQATPTTVTLRRVRGN